MRIFSSRCSYAARGPCGRSWAFLLAVAAVVFADVTWIEAAGHAAESRAKPTINGNHSQTAANALFQPTEGRSKINVPWTSPNRFRVLLKVDPRGRKRSNSPASVEIDFQEIIAQSGGAGTFDEHTVGSLL